MSTGNQLDCLPNFLETLKLWWLLVKEEMEGRILQLHGNDSSKKEKATVAAAAAG